MDEKPGTKLHCFYDMAVSPCSFDFFSFLYAEKFAEKEEILMK